MRHVFSHARTEHVYDCLSMYVIKYYIYIYIYIYILWCEWPCGRCASGYSRHTVHRPVVLITMCTAKRYATTVPVSTKTGRRKMLLYIYRRNDNHVTVLFWQHLSLFIPGLYIWSRDQRQGVARVAASIARYTVTHRYTRPFRLCDSLLSTAARHCFNSLALILPAFFLMSLAPVTKFSFVF